MQKHKERDPNKQKKALMHRLTIYSIGKTKEAWLESALDEYTKRLKPSATISWILAKENKQLEKLVDQEPFLACLDPAGDLMTSEKFSTWLNNSLVTAGARLAFVIGGATGLSKQLRQKASCLISLSPLTFTHQITRLVLLEQLYRAFEIQKGSAYHK